MTNMTNMAPKRRSFFMRYFKYHVDPMTFDNRRVLLLLRTKKKRS